ncbi:unannotated protein [freshwater metagenome]|uniref:Unannotated protein n=1 Tax=freshwater metagenome TaxID=449393 RepID=A0A6J6E919_9ZZZZ
MSPFATVMMSGSIPNRSEPNIEPKRPNPVTTSSAIIKTSYFFKTFWIAGKYSFGGTITPPAACNGSAMKAATVSGPSLRIKASSSSASVCENSASVAPGAFSQIR